ncbi:MAG: response regulator [Bacteroidales bacterium]|nr:response regulator [Bacteroidales bacterium]MBN2820395.1 response regulator [Bacteroidales bacterium]
MNKHLITILFITVLTVRFMSGNNIVIHDINAEYGISKNRVNCMLQDSKGFLWFGMVNGLYKFDLNSFTKYATKEYNNQGFPELDVRAIFELKPGKLLIGSSKGLFVFNVEKETYDTITCNAFVPLSGLSIQSICSDDQNSIWLGTDAGLLNLIVNNYENDKLELDLVRQFDNSNSNLISSYIVEVIKSPENEIWFLTLADIGYFSVLKQNIISFELYGANASIFADGRDILYSSFGDGVQVFKTSDYSFERVDHNEILENSKARYAFKDSKGNYWLSISNVGLLLMDSLSQKSNIELISYKKDSYSALNSNVIYRIYETTDGAIWLCTEEGINMIALKMAVFKTKACRSANNEELAMGVRALSKSEKNNILVGTVGDGLVRYNTESDELLNIPFVNNGDQYGNIVQAILKDSYGNLWLGTEADGVIRFKYEDLKKTPANIINYRAFPVSFPQNTLFNDYVMCLLEDKHKNIWVGTWYGLYFFEGNEINRSDQQNINIKVYLNNPDNKLSISNNVVMSLIEGKDGVIWAGTHAGINKITITDSGYNFSSDFYSSDGESLKNKNILDIYQDGKGDIWFSTQDGGISLLDVEDGIYKEFNSSNGFHDHIVNSISQDSLGILWLGTNNGLCRYDPQTNTFNMYYTEDGLLSNDFFYRSVCWVDNQLFLGGNKGITYFNPYEIVPGKIEPNLVFTNFKLFNEEVIISSKKSPLDKHISYSKELILKHNQNYITLEFATLNYMHQKEIQYECVLEGLESSWNKLRQERKITYTSLKPGKYVFRVKSNTYGQNETLAELSIPITIKPPIWLSGFAYSIYFIIVILILFYTNIYFLNQEKKKHAFELERMNAKRLHDMDMMKLQFYTNVSHELRTPLTLISSPLESLMSEQVDNEKRLSYYQLMHKNVQRLRRLITQLLDMRKIEEGHIRMEWSQGDVIDFIKLVLANFETFAERRNISYLVDCPKQSLLTYFDADKLEKVIFNLLSNAFKYTPDKGSVIVKIDVDTSHKRAGFENGSYTLKFIDTGFGIPQESIRNIYKPFHQVKKNKPIYSAGSGLGLSLTKELVELQKGEITVESEEGKGSEFTIVLPVVKTIPENELNQEKEINKDVEEDVAINESFKDPKGKGSLVLIVEDDPDLRSFISSELSGIHRVIEASNGKEGLEIAFESIPDIIVSDVMMDELDGIDMCKQLKTDIRTSHIPVILLTARHSEEIKQNSFEIGADDYITKPFNVSLLQTRISNLIEQRRSLRKLFAADDQLDFSKITTNTADEKFIEKLNSIINKNIDNQDFSPISLAAEMAMSKMQLYRKVSALTNQTVYNYIRTIRMNKATHLLVTTDMQISEIAYSVGFSEASNFTKTFFKYYNCTPSQFSKKHRT